jgi:hypothetical protein
VVSGAIVVNAIVTAPATSGAGIAVIASGLPIYWWTRLRHATANVSEFAPGRSTF